MVRLVPVYEEEERTELPVSLYLNIQQEGGRLQARKWAFTKN